MSSTARYTLHHPKWHRRRVSVWWWLERWSYARFVLRELTSVSVALFALVTLWQVRSLAAGPEAHARFQERLASPGFLALHAVGLVVVLFHSITWFNLAPRAMVVRIKGRRLPDWLVSGANYAGWLALSLVVAFFLLRR
jgi:fumarate reductase subunit C